VDITKKSPTVLSLCSGYSGLEIGLERAIGKINVLAHVEVEAFAVANLVDKMETGRMVPAPIWTDVKTFNAKIFRGCVDILTGGYPCQPFSAAGKRKGTDDPRHLWPYIKSIIMDCEPRRVFFENVEGHLSLGIAEVLADLEEMGYRVEAGIFSAAEVGAPHQRKRVFILGHTQSDNERRLPLSPMHREGIEIRGPGCQLADSQCKGLEKYIIKSRAQQKKMEPPTREDTSGVCQVWPARPGEPQYCWEEPRVVADPKSRKSGKQEAGNRGEDTGGGSEEDLEIPGGLGWRGGCENLEKYTGGPLPETETTGHGEPRNITGEQGKIKPQLGRAIARTSGGLDTVEPFENRIDRLRLLGNGVVPQTAEKAFRTLYNKLIPLDI
jgi:DNA (cytosine-5)-methyltransferase 1